MSCPFLHRMAVALLALAGATGAVGADSYPSRTIRIVVTSAPGGAVDLTTRAVAQHLTEKLAQPVIVENRSGAGGLIGIRSVKTAPADGYTLLSVVNTIATQQAVSPDPGYEIGKDLIGIAPITRSPFLLVSGSNGQDRTLSDLLARAKAKPGQLSYASAGNGSTTHFCAAVFAQRAGLNLLHVPYKGNSASWPDLISGRVDMLMEAYSSGASMIRSGQLKVLGVTSAKRLELMPDVPTIAEQGVRDYSFYLWMGLLAPSGTPRPIVEKLAQAVRSVLAHPDLQKRFREEGSEVMSMSPEEFTSFLKDEANAYSRLVTDLAIPRS